MQKAPMMEPIIANVTEPVKLDDCGCASTTGSRAPGAGCGERAVIPITSMAIEGKARVSANLAISSEKTWEAAACVISLRLSAMGWATL